MAKLGDMKKLFALLDKCYPDYFSGYHRSVIAVSMMPQMTSKDVADSIKIEVAEMETDFTDDENKLIDEYVTELLKSPEEMFHDDPDETNESCSEEYQVYGYFSIINPVYVGGIMFLDR